MKKYILIFSVFLIGCNKNCPADNDKIIKAKNKTIDSLKAKLEDCKAQAKIMADVLEEDRINDNKKATH